MIGLSVFVLLNILASALFSDCGLPALFGLGACAGNQTRASFPFVFFEQGSFAFHSNFNLPLLILGLSVGIGFAAFTGFFTGKNNK